jgi:hypothetical protein
MTTQAFTPLEGTTLFADSYGRLNDSNAANRVDFEGPTAPTPTVAYMKWNDTTTGTKKERNAANDGWITVGILGATHHGHLPAAGGTMTGAIAMGGAKVTGLGAPTVNGDAARFDELATKAPIASPAFTTDATLNVDPPGNNSLIRKIWAEGRYLKLAGGSMTALFNLFADATSALHAVTLQQLKAFVLFNTSTGHRHDGTDARKVRGTDIDSGAATNLQALRANGSGGGSYVSAPTISVITTPTVLADENPPSASFVTITLGPSGLALTSAGDPVALIYIQAFSATQMRIRKLGDVDDSASMNFDVSTTWGDWGRLFLCPLDANGAFQYRRSGTSAHTVIRFGGRFRVC